MRSFLNPLLIITIASSLAACGGGGSGSGSTTTAPSPDQVVKLPPADNSTPGSNPPKETIPFQASLNSYQEYLPRVHSAFALTDYPGGIEDFTAYPDGKVSFNIVFSPDRKPQSKLLSADGSSLSPGFEYNADYFYRLKKSPAIIHKNSANEQKQSRFYLHKAGETSLGQDLSGDTIEGYVSSYDYGADINEQYFIYFVENTGSLYYNSLINPGAPQLIQDNVLDTGNRFKFFPQDGSSIYLPLVQYDENQQSKLNLYRFHFEQKKLDLIDTISSNFFAYEQNRLIDNNRYLLYKKSAAYYLYNTETGETTALNSLLGDYVIASFGSKSGFGSYSESTQTLVTQLRNTKDNKRSLVSLNPITGQWQKLKDLASGELLKTPVISQSGKQFYISNTDQTQIYQYIENQWHLSPHTLSIKDDNRLQWVDQGKSLLVKSEIDSGDSLDFSLYLMNPEDGSKTVLSESVSAVYSPLHYSEANRSIFFFDETDKRSIDKLTHYSLTDGQQTAVMDVDKTYQTNFLKDDQQGIWISSSIANNSQSRLFRYQFANGTLTDISAGLDHFISEDTRMSVYPSNAYMRSPNGNALAFLTKASGEKAGAIVLNNSAEQTSCRIEFSQNISLNMRTGSAAFTSDNRYFYYLISDMQYGYTYDSNVQLVRARVSDCKLTRMDTAVPQTVSSFWLTPDDSKLVIATLSGGLITLESDGSRITQIEPDYPNTFDSIRQIEFVDNNQKILFFAEGRSKSPFILANLDGSKSQLVETEDKEVWADLFSRISITPDRTALIYYSTSRPLTRVQLTGDQISRSDIPEEVREVNGRFIHNSNLMINSDYYNYSYHSYLYDFDNNTHVDLSAIIPQDEVFSHSYDIGQSGEILLQTRIIHSKTYRLYRFNPRQQDISLGEVIAEIQLPDYDKLDYSFFSADESGVLYSVGENCGQQTIYRQPLQANTPPQALASYHVSSRCYNAHKYDDQGRLLFVDHQQSATTLYQLPAGSNSAKQVVTVPTQVDLKVFFTAKEQPYVYISMDKDRKDVYELYQYPLN